MSRLFGAVSLLKEINYLTVGWLLICWQQKQQQQQLQSFIVSMIIIVIITIYIFNNGRNNQSHVFILHCSKKVFKWLYYITMQQGIQLFKNKSCNFNFNTGTISLFIQVLYCMCKFMVIKIEAKVNVIATLSGLVFPVGAFNVWDCQ